MNKHNSSRAMVLMKAGFWFLLWVLIVILLLSACAETRYIKYDQREEGSDFPWRTVAYEVDTEFYATYPDCALVMPVKSPTGLERLSSFVETSLSKNLTRKITRVIGPRRRDVAIRRLAVEPEHPDDRRVLVEYLNCDSVVTTEVIDPGSDYLLVWSQARIGLEVKLIRANDGHVLWRARHSTRRSEGGVPLSPFAIAIDAFSTARFSSDAELAESMIDDAVRRLVISLPDAVSFRNSARSF